MVSGLEKETVFGQRNIEIDGCGGKFNVRRCAVYEGQCRKIFVCLIVKGLRFIIEDK